MSVSAGNAVLVDCELVVPISPCRRLGLLSLSSQQVEAVVG